jgi:hypothetical protein
MCSTDSLCAPERRDQALLQHALRPLRRTGMCRLLSLSEATRMKWGGAYEPDAPAGWQPGAQTRCCGDVLGKPPQLDRPPALGGKLSEAGHSRAWPCLPFDMK